MITSWSHSPTRPRPLHRRFSSILWCRGLGTSRGGRTGRSLGSMRGTVDPLIEELSKVVDDCSCALISFLGGYGEAVEGLLEMLIT